MGLIVRHRAVALILSVIYPLVSATPTFAAGPDNAPCSGDNAHFGGEEAYTAGIQKHGASGTIEGQDLHQCTQPAGFETNGTFAWAAILDGGIGEEGGSVIMQVGIGKCREVFPYACGSDMRYMWAWGRDDSAPGCFGWSHISATPQVIGSWNGAAHDFKVYHKDNRYRFYIDTTEHASISENSICWTPTRAHWFSETWDDGDALGGSVGNKLTTSSTNYANAENGGFFWTQMTAPCRFAGDGPRHCSIVNGTTLRTWTER